MVVVLNILCALLKVTVNETGTESSEVKDGVRFNFWLPVVRFGNCRKFGELQELNIMRRKKG